VTTYSKRDRERAVEALMLCADDRTSSGVAWGLCTNEIGVSVEADNLANAAYEVAAQALAKRKPHRGSTMFEDYTEAAALLMDGWNPGDPVVPLTPPKRARGRGRGTP
jgi:hypothetical protein